MESLHLCSDKDCQPRGVNYDGLSVSQYLVILHKPFKARTTYALLRLPEKQLPITAITAVGVRISAKRGVTMFVRYLSRVDPIHSLAK